MEKWLKPEKSMTDYRYIVARYILEDEEDGVEETGILVFNGLKCRWFEINGNGTSIMMKEIKLWFPLPEIER